ncbi:hypothetical protein AB4323_23025 [Vibrio sp. 10N.261.52.C11]|uniref:hypothetical protein n=1 Tax=Vibrio sp. 10N.261.52.C11 TaxID=3229680 RepID=UPI0035538110
MPCITIQSRALCLGSLFAQVVRKYVRFHFRGKLTCCVKDSLAAIFVETGEQDYFGEIQISRGDEKCHMPIYKTESGITVNQDARALK